MLAIRAARLIDGTGRDPVLEALVLVEGNRIVVAGPSASGRLPRGVEVIDIGDVTVLPGLVDAHAHLSFCLSPGDLKRQTEEPPIRAALTAAKTLREKLAHGITLLRNPGEKYYLDAECKRALADGVVVGPHLISAGLGLRASHGAGHVAVPADGCEELRWYVRRNLARGADFIKIFVGGPFGGSIGAPDDCYYSQEELRTVVAEAHRAGKLVAAHVSGGTGADWCIEAGVDAIEHGFLLTEEQIERLVDKRIWLVFTPILGQLPDTVTGNRDKFPPATVELAEHALSAYRQAIDAGVRLAVGTDDGAPGVLLADCVSFLVRLGLGAMDAVLMVTRAGAELCGMLGVCGTLEPGKLANLVAVRGDPSSKPEALRNVVFVMKEGIPITWFELTTCDEGHRFLM